MYRTGNRVDNVQAKVRRNRQLRVNDRIDVLAPTQEYSRCGSTFLRRRRNILDAVYSQYASVEKQKDVKSPVTAREEWPESKPRLDNLEVVSMCDSTTQKTSCGADPMELGESARPCE